MYWCNGDMQCRAIGRGMSDPNYDAAGNMTSDHRGYEYVYDGDNRLWRVWKDDVLLVQYIKDALGRRIRKEDFIRGTTTRYLWSGQNVVAEYDDEYERLRYYVHGPTYIDERVVMHDEATDRDYVYLMKDLYTVAGLADRQGWPVESYDYDAYGRVWMRRCAVLPWAADLDGDGDVDASDHAIFEDHYAGSGEEPNGVAGWRSDLDCDGDVDGSDYVWFAHAYNGDAQAPRGNLSLLTASTAESQVGNAYFFTGRRLDVLDIDDANTPHHFTDDQPNLTLYYYRARTMEPVLGRFGQRDPLGYVAGMNLYEYAMSNPRRYADPLGANPYEYDEGTGGGTAPGNPNSDYGVTWCSPMEGRMRSHIYRELCAGKCVAAHEQKHRYQRGECCRRLGLCRLRNGLTTCMRHYNAWYDETKQRFECEAYRHQLNCVQATLQFGRMDDGSPMTSACCTELRAHIPRIRNSMRRACERAGRRPVASCPFDSHGRIHVRPYYRYPWRP